MIIGNALSIGMLGMKAFLIQLQAFVSEGLPAFSIIGLPDTSLCEARERVKSACRTIGYRWPQTRVTVNLSPAAMPKHGSSYDLAIAASVLSTKKIIPTSALHNTVLLGELNLDGSILPVHGVLPSTLYAKDQGIQRMIVPFENLAEAQLVNGIETIGIHTIRDLVVALHGKLAQQTTTTTSSPEDTSLARQQTLDLGSIQTPEMLLSMESTVQVGDMSEVLGQEHAKWALEVAAAGGHHMLMIGPPGSGKTMLASRMPGIMCPLDENEQLEVASIRSLCGTLAQYGISDIPPFEAPHHTASSAALIGGGSGIAQPGIITKAHRGVLFIDEAPEISPRVLQTLREPLESGFVAVSRSKGTVFYPARFQLIMAANPCPCGYAYGNAERCTCKERDRIRYFSRLSGPILDRIDIQMDVPAVERIEQIPPHNSAKNAASSQFQTQVMSSATMRKHVITARRIAQERFRQQGWSCNAQASGTWLRQYTSRQSINLINHALEQHQLSLRGADRTLRLAWSLADLSGHTSPSVDDVAQAISLRTRICSH